MRFVSWLWEQMEDPGTTADFAKVCWNDVNNGCAHVKFTVKQWQDHFFDKHTENSQLLVKMLIDAYVTYQREVKGKIAF